MKRIYISDVVHEQLKKEAKSEGRTLQWVVEDRLTRGSLYTRSSETPTVIPPLVNRGVPKNINTPQSRKDDISDLFNTPAKNIVGATPMSVGQIVHSGVTEGEKTLMDMHDAIDKPGIDLEKPCCLNELQPCQHWVWDTATGEGYKNTLSGRFREAE